MDRPKTTRPFRQRFLNGYDRSELRAEVEKVKPKRLSSLRRKYATWALGGALAFGGIGIPMKVGTMLKNADATSAASPRPPAPDEVSPEKTTTRQIASDLTTAQQIAKEVASGVSSGLTSAAQDVAQTVAPTAVAEKVAEAPLKLAVITEEVKRAFFQTEVPFGSIIYSEAKKNNLPPELVAAVAHTESQFVPTARSQAGAVGVMQLIPRTGRWLGASNLVDPAQNIMAGAKYLRYLTDRFGGNTQEAVAAYNAGEGNVRRFGGIPPFRETRDYVQRVLHFQQDLGDRLQSHLASLTQ